jgi:hypothetical protein
MPAPLVFQLKDARKGDAQETVRLIYTSVNRFLLKGVTNIVQIMNVGMFIFYTPRIQGFGRYHLFNIPHTPTENENI